MRGLGRRAWSREPGTAYLGPAEVYPPEIGDGSALVKVTGFIPNGWDGHGTRVADPADRRGTSFGRATARGGWVLDMDALDPGGDLPGKLRREGGYGITHPHAVSLSRADSSSFTADDATQALHAVRSALSLILGRPTDVVLPVGWSHDQAAWARWTAGQVDTFREPGTWLDASIAADQVSEVIGRFLDCWPDSLRSDTLRHAMSYYIQGAGARRRTRHRRRRIRAVAWLHHQDRLPRTVPRIAANRWLGYTEDVPWTGC